MSATAPDLSLLLHEAQIRRRHENVINTFKFIGILVLTLVISGSIMILAAPNPIRVMETTGQFLQLAGAFLIVMIWFTGGFLILFWPFLLYFEANVRVMRQWMLLSLLQTSIATGKPLQNIIRGYATSCSARYAARLQRFADALESGSTLEDAVREHRGLFRYDVAGMIRFGDSPETLRSLETVAQDERDYAAIRTISIVRIFYLCV